MKSNSVVIFGAGAVGRGFIGRIVSANCMRPVFIDPNAQLVQRLNKTGQYKVLLVGNAKKEITVSGFEAITPEHTKQAAEAIDSCLFAASAVGGQNLKSVADILKSPLAKRKSPLNILVCENWPQAEKVLDKALVDFDCEKKNFSCISCSVERMARRKDTGLDVLAEGGIALYADSRAFKGRIPDIPGFVFCTNIEAIYARKLYTSNLGHACLAYLGHLRGCQYVYEAMDVPEIKKYLLELFGVVREGFLKSYDMHPRELDRHIEELLSWRYSNRDLADTINRVARSPLRKLGPKERLVGVARMLEKHKLPTECISRVIAAAMLYRDADDPQSRDLEKMIAEKGPGAVLENVCGFGKQDDCYRQSVEFFEMLGKERPC